jgi:hypothetical protein
MFSSRNPYLLPSWRNVGLLALTARRRRQREFASCQLRECARCHPPFQCLLHTRPSLVCCRRTASFAVGRDTRVTGASRRRVCSCERGRMRKCPPLFSRHLARCFIASAARVGIAGLKISRLQVTQSQMVYLTLLLRLR